MKKYIPFLLIVLLLVACNTKKDFDENLWGSSVKEIIKFEDKNGNSDYEEDTTFDDGKELIFPNKSVNGKKADVHYTFNNQIESSELIYLADFFSGYDKFIAQMNDESIPEPDKIELLDEFEKKNKKAFQELEEIPDILTFDDQILLTIDYFYQEFTEKESKELLKELKNIYGDNPIEGNSSYTWDTDKSIVYFDGFDYVSYTPKYQTIEEYVSE
ncbi:hypothetical protein [Lederbergia graminis]|uniref:Lipoprotein n=1 Tax=Lederbergia graminis TaxID=735518 RepID=A0ABW0LHM7_9BACI|nr:hypothetical protein [Bacillaceae bacterium]